MLTTTTTTTKLLIIFPAIGFDLIPFDHCCGGVRIRVCLIVAKVVRLAGHHPSALTLFVVFFKKKKKTKKKSFSLSKIENVLNIMAKFVV